MNRILHLESIALFYPLKNVFCIKVRSLMISENWLFASLFDLVEYDNLSDEHYVLSVDEFYESHFK